MKNRVKHTAFGVPVMDALAHLGGGALNLAGSGLDATVAAGQLTLEAATALAKTGIQLAVATPIAAGLGTGLIVSRMTSPTSQDIDTQETQLVNARLKTMAGENNRRLATDLAAYRDSHERKTPNA